MRGYDSTGELSFDVDGGPYTLPPGEEADVPLTARAEQRPLIGVPSFYPFETRVEQRGAGVVHRSTEHLRVTPIIPIWLLLLLPLLFACGALFFGRLPIISPPVTATATATPTATGSTPITVTPTATGAATVTATPTATGASTGTPTNTPGATPTSTPSPTGTPSPTPTPTPTQTSTPTMTPTAGPPEVITYPPLTFSVTINWRPDPASEMHAIADVQVSAQGGDGNYTYFRDDILQPGPAFSYFWQRCSSNPISFRVDSGDGQSVRMELAEFAPCFP